MSQILQVLVLEGPQGADLLTQPTPNRVELLILHIQWLNLIIQQPPAHNPLIHQAILHLPLAVTWWQHQTQYQQTAV